MTPIKRSCAESCLDFFVLELVHKYTSEESNAKAIATLEAIGARVGKQLAERCAKDRPRMIDDLDVVKFICKEFWSHVFQKLIDNLRTNHRGVYVLQDNHFRWMEHISVTNAADMETPEKARIIQQYLALPCGLIKGALKHLGVNCSVSGDALNLPMCSFTVKFL
eukprot:g1502.t1